MTDKITHPRALSALPQLQQALKRAETEVGALIERAHVTGCGHAAREAADYMRFKLGLDYAQSAEVAHRVAGIEHATWDALLSLPRATPASRARLRALRSRVQV